MALLDEELSQSMTFDEERQHQHQSESSIIDPWDDLAWKYEQARRHEKAQRRERKQAWRHKQARRKRLQSPAMDDSDPSNLRKPHGKENRNFSLRTLEIYDDLHSKNAPEAVWKADEWLVRLNFSWLDHTVADSCSLVRGSESTV